MALIKADQKLSGPGPLSLREFLLKSAYVSFFCNILDSVIELCLAQMASVEAEAAQASSQLHTFKRWMFIEMVFQI